MKTDFNDRERKRHAATLRDVAETAIKAADALESNNDEESLINFTLLQISGASIVQISKEVITALESSKDTDFPDIIGK